jgi:hypothetical protein
MRRSLFIALITAGLTLGLASPALADNPHAPGTTGQPSQSCQNYAANVRPGNSANSPGAPFNEPGINSVNGGTGGNAYNAAGANSQYDVACFQQSVH